MIQLSHNATRFHSKVLILLTLAIGCLLGLPACMTRKNTRGVRQEGDPKKEFSDWRKDGCHGMIWRAGPNLVLRVDDLFSSDRVLQMVVPAQPTGADLAIGRAMILGPEAREISGTGAQAVKVGILDGVFDRSSSVIEREMGFSQGMPTKVVLGIHVEKRGPGPEVVTYTLAYKTAANRRYVTAAGAAELPWMKRSRTAQAGRALLYPLTVPGDAAMVPVEAGALMLMHPRRR